MAKQILNAGSIKVKVTRVWGSGEVAVQLPNGIAENDPGR